MGLQCWDVQGGRCNTIMYCMYQQAIQLDIHPSGSQRRTQCKRPMPVHMRPGHLHRIAGACVMIFLFLIDTHMISGPPHDNKNRDAKRAETTSSRHVLPPMISLLPRGASLRESAQNAMASRHAARGRMQPRYNATTGRRRTVTTTSTYHLH